LRVYSDGAVLYTETFL